jgi:hypothetical protein
MPPIFFWKLKNMMRFRNNEQEADNVIDHFVCAGGGRSIRAFEKVAGMGDVMSGSNDRAFGIKTTHITVNGAISHCNAGCGPRRATSSRIAAARLLSSAVMGILLSVGHPCYPLARMVSR